MAVKQLQDEDDAEYRRLLRHAFDWQMTPAEEKANLIQFQHASAWGVGEPLQSGLTATHYQVQFGKTTYKMAGIGDVASYPEASGEGHVTELMHTALTEMAAQGYTVSYLMPFSVPFYRHYGFEAALTETRHEIETKSLPRISAPVGVKVVRQNWETAFPASQAVYDRSPLIRRGGLKREDWWWQLRPLRDPDELVAVAARDGAPSGYMTYKRKNDGFLVTECFFDDPASGQALAAFACAHRNTAKKFDYLTPDPTWLGDLLPDSDALTSTTGAYGMARILNVQDFLQRYPYRVQTLEPIVIHVLDPFMPANDGNWQLQIDQGQASVARTLAAAQLSLTTRQLVKASFGVRSLQAAAMLGQVSGEQSAIAALSPAFTVQPALFYDYF